MPTPLPSGEKAAFIAIVKVVRPLEEARLTAIMNNYEDIVTAIGRSAPLFANNNGFLKEAIGCFSSDAALNAVGIYRNSSTASLTNPIMLINYSITTAINITANQDALIILGPSSIKLISIATTKRLKNLFFGPGASADISDSSAAGAFINNITLASGNSQNSSLNYAVLGSGIGSVNIHSGSYFGGQQSVDPTATCAIPVTGLNAINITKDSVKLLWTPPSSGYLFINIYFRKNGEAVWIKADESVGEFITNVGFFFQGLQEDTYYDFKVDVICNNGGIATTSIIDKTTGIVNLAGDATCLFYVKIKASPSAAQIAVCDGTMINEEYPEGPTLVIPYLINRNIKTDVVIGTSTYQQFPYDKTSGTLNAAGCSKQNFLDGDIVSIEVKTP